MLILCHEMHIFNVVIKSHLLIKTNIKFVFFYVKQLNSVLTPNTSPQFSDETETEHYIFTC